MVSSILYILIPLISICLVQALPWILCPTASHRCQMDRAPSRVKPIFSFFHNILLSWPSLLQLMTTVLLPLLRSQFWIHPDFSFSFIIFSKSFWSPFKIYPERDHISPLPLSLCWSNPSGSCLWIILIAATVFVCLFICLSLWSWSPTVYSNS